ncbi:MAG: nucleotide exchange factor GrpE [Alcanivoracaceae bacterium]
MSEQEKDPNELAAEAVAPEVAPELAEDVAVDLAAELASLREQFADVSRQLAEADLRAQAEIQNMRRRMEREVANAHKFALEKFSADLLPVADNLERGLSAVPAEDEALKAVREGIELTLKSLADVFVRHGIEGVDPRGSQFDPQLHEAMAMVPVPGAEPNSIIDVLEKGYSLNGRLIRPARVVVAKNP